GLDDQEDSIFFGLYDAEAAKFDDIVYHNSKLSIFKAAGNERNWTAEPDLFDPSFVVSGDHCALAANGSFMQSQKKRPRDTRKGGHDTMTGVALAKNVITVGAMADLAADWTAKNIKVTDFSSFGPADDGRIKP